MESRQFNLAMSCEYDVLWKLSISYGFGATQQQSGAQAWLYISVDDHWKKMTSSDQPLPFTYDDGKSTDYA